MKEPYKLKYWESLVDYSSLPSAHISLSTRMGYGMSADVCKGDMLFLQTSTSGGHGDPGGSEGPHTYIEWRHFLDEAEAVRQYYFGD